MRIRMKVPYDNGKIHLEKGDEGVGISERDRARFVRAGLAEEIKPVRRAKAKKPAKSKARPEKPVAAAVKAPNTDEASS